MSIISAIVPVYKVEQYLDRCIKSILAQTYSDFELILVDDGSPDNCPAMCDEWAGKDDRIIVIHQENGGLSAARNAGIDWAFANSNSEWITFIDSDDWVHPEMLERLLCAAVDTDTKISICGFAKTYGEEPLIKDNDLVYKIWATEDFFVKNRVNAVVAWGKLYQKILFQNVRYPLRKQHEDEFITHKLLFANEQIVATPAPLYNYYQNINSIMNSEWNLKRLDFLDAANEQLRYFSNNGYKQAWNIVQKVYLNATIDNLDSIDISNLDRDTKSNHKNKVIRQLRSFLLKNRCIYPFKDNKWIYEKAYPRTMKLYWILKGKFSNKH